MTSKQIRQQFLDFFKQRGHTIVPSASVIPYDDPTLLFTNAGMNQFKDVFLGTGKRDYTRSADSQKCIRVSGKHNDLEEVGRDTYHHTFFEMLGNWSFGDYYKKEAIEWAWELLTNVWGLEKKRLHATVFETDDEAEQLWKTITDIEHSHIHRFGKKDNFWEMGETGPCGPCSEIHIDLTDDLSGGHLVNAGDPRVMEIWNLVFIQYNRDASGELSPLPAKHVDTGMGFERICAVLQKKKSNYDTDVFTPIIAFISKLTGKLYQDDNFRAKHRLVDVINDVSEEDRVAMRVIADHIRMLTFSIADGGVPSNEGRGYVMRRILRRAARFGRNLGMKEPFIYKVVQAVVDSMRDQFPEIKEKQSFIERVIKAEEESFNATLDNGLKLFKETAFNTLYDHLREEGYNTSVHQSEIDPSQTKILILEESKASKERDRNYLIRNGLIIVGSLTKEYDNLGSYALEEWNSALSARFFKNSLQIKGKDVFKLYDTFGFPIDLTALLARERGFEIDQSGFDKYMEMQKLSSRFRNETSKSMELSRSHIGVGVPSKKFAIDFTKDVEANALRFVGYEHFENVGRVVKSEEASLIVDNTPFYGESGGQLGDEGIIVVDKATKIEVMNTLKANDIVVMVLGVEINLPRGKELNLIVNKPRRLNIMKNHTATHLFHEALRRVIGEHSHQQGSLVAPDHLRFDFNHFEKVTPEQIKAIEEMVNEKIADNIQVHALNDPKEWLPIEDAKKRYPNLKMFFGEKYGDKVRVVEIDPKFSVELCGGTHVKNTKEIGLFKIISEGSVASGVRRIEAVTGEGLQNYIQQQIEKVGQLDEQIAKLIEEKEELEKQLGVNGKSDVGRGKVDRGEVTSPLQESLGDISITIGNITSKEISNVENAIQQREQTIEQVTKSTHDLKKELSKSRLKEASSGIDSLIANASEVNGFKVVASKVEVADGDELKNLGDTLRSKLGSGVGVLAAIIDGKVSLVCVVTDDVIKEKKLQAGKIVGELAKKVGGGGGGRPHLATAGGKDVEKVEEMLAGVVGLITNIV